MSEPSLVEFGKIDRANWPAGPWDDEPDVIRWIDTATNRFCLIRRGPSGNLCGYVGIAHGHPWHGVDEGQITPYPEVHGGLTFSDFIDSDQPWWWIGFDCAHARDLLPSLTPLDAHQLETYKDVSYVKAECARLAAQAEEAAA